MNKEPLRILLVEDDEDDYILTSELLTEIKGSPIEIEWVDNFEEALEVMLRNEHQVYLVDYRMGAEDGLALVRDCIANGCKAPIIVLTGYGDHEIDLEAMEAGAVDYLIKGEINTSSLERSIRYALEHKRVEADLSEMQQRLADSREEERLHLAQELHDGPLQDLIGIRFLLQVITNVIEHEEAEKQLDVAQEGLHEVMQTLRALCGELRPPALAPFGLQRAIRAHAQRFQKAHPELHVELELDADHQSLSERMRLALFRIYQHAVANVARHAKADNLRIRFELRPKQVMLKIADDGCGFELPKRWIEFARQGHLGLLGAAERAESVGGKLEVQSAPNGGTTLIVTVPRH